MAGHSRNQFLFDDFSFFLKLLITARERVNVKIFVMENERKSSLLQITVNVVIWHRSFLSCVKSVFF
jgi:hypothetical protein